MKKKLSHKMGKMRSFDNVLTHWNENFLSAAVNKNNNNNNFCSLINGIYLDLAWISPSAI
jgi:hypothetical protein